MIFSKNNFNVEHQMSIKAERFKMDPELAMELKHLFLL